MKKLISSQLLRKSLLFIKKFLKYCPSYSEQYQCAGKANNLLKGTKIKYLTAEKKIVLEATCLCSKCKKKKHLSNHGTLMWYLAYQIVYLILQSSRLLKTLPVLLNSLWNISDSVKYINLDFWPFRHFDWRTARLILRRLKSEWSRMMNIQKLEVLITEI